MWQWLACIVYDGVGFTHPLYPHFLRNSFQNKECSDWKGTKERMQLLQTDTDKTPLRQFVINEQPQASIGPQDTPNKEAIYLNL